jgi:hypothetical protein
MRVGQREKFGAGVRRSRAFQSNRAAANSQQVGSNFAARADRVHRLKFRVALQPGEVSAQHISYRTCG